MTKGNQGHELSKTGPYEAEKEEGDAGPKDSQGILGRSQQPLATSENLWGTTRFKWRQKACIQEVRAKGKAGEVTSNKQSHPEHSLER